ncbi:MAG TPA: alanine racemase, partial [Burkholderiales bacterium]|nr:alanine racemase [Burkholderiales bacterium]
MTRPIAARISLRALSENLALARRYAPGSRMLSVIKANAYGHGLIRTAGALSASEGFALLDLDDALSLRQAGYRQKIVLLEGFFSLDELDEISENGIDVVIHCREQIEMLESRRLKKKVDVFLKCNTGMNRLGFRPELFWKMIGRLKENENAGEIVSMTHFCCADGEEGVKGQMDVFEAASEGSNLPASLANSAALIRYP